MSQPQHARGGPVRRCLRNRTTKHPQRLEHHKQQRPPHQPHRYSDVSTKSTSTTSSDGDTSAANAATEAGDSSARSQDIEVPFTVASGRVGFTSSAAAVVALVAVALVP